MTCCNCRILQQVTENRSSSNVAGGSSDVPEPKEDLNCWRFKSSSHTNPHSLKKTKRNPHDIVSFSFQTQSATGYGHAARFEYSNCGDCGSFAWFARSWWLRLSQCRRSRRGGWRNQRSRSACSGFAIKPLRAAWDQTTNDAKRSESGTTTGRHSAQVVKLRLDGRTNSKQCHRQSGASSTRRTLLTSDNTVHSKAQKLSIGVKLEAFEPLKHLCEAMTRHNNPRRTR